MPSDAYREARAAAREARTAAKQARKHWRRLRPWYFKKRFILGIPVLLLMAAVVIIGMLSIEDVPFGSEDESASRPADAAATGPAPTPAPTGEASPAAPSEVARIGTTVRVGSIDLTILGVEAFDGRAFNSANDANYRVRFRFTNARGPSGEDYRLTESAFQLLDDAGTPHRDWQTSCQSCPDDVAGGRVLARGATFEGAVYFRVPSGELPARLDYQSPSSTNRARITLR